MASFASQLWQLRKPTTNRNDDVNANGSIDQSAPMDGQESVLYSDPFSNAVPVIDPFSGDALKNDLFKALAGAPVLNANHQANDGFDQSLESTNPFTKPSDQVISKALIQANDYRSEDIPGGMKCEDSDFSDLCHIGDKEVVSISSKMTTSTLSNATSWSKQHFSSLDASMVSSFGDMSSSAPTSNSAKTSALTSNPQSSSSATVLISGSSDNEQLLSCELRSMVNSTFEVDSGHSTETVPSCVYRELVDETDAEPNTSHNEGPLPDQEDNPEKQATGVLQVPQILFTEATLLSSEGSSFEAVRTTEGVGEGRTYLLESITAEDETSITKDERCYKPSKVIVFKATESDEEIAGEGDASIDKEDANGARHIDYETLETQLDVSGNHQNRIMNLSDIEPSDGTEKTHEFESPTLDSEYRRRSAPNEFFPNGEVDLTDLDCLTKTCSVGDLNKGDNCLNIVEQPKVLTSSPIASSCGARSSTKGSLSLTLKNKRPSKSLRWKPNDVGINGTLVDRKRSVFNTPLILKTKAASAR
ncbi:uncharacterized protein LOC111265327 isoform X2 [Varroa jacobsoni]|uniref:Uncharacterized protein n=1 Tax=Varroa destructor TaxID=109461 RepID=A0A7M7KXM7_VARDE|nr:uncharacterized protein LOC111254464 isoform X2 [Varroa destructor]XP_022697663.1 uncharacterized protein LOC111265327 isoform X2 [Varroa jacobsoni]